MTRLEFIKSELDKHDICSCKIHGVYINGFYYDYDEEEAIEKALDECFKGTEIFITGLDWIMRIYINDHNDSNAEFYTKQE